MRFYSLKFCFNNSRKPKRNHKIKNMSINKLKNNFKLQQFDKNKIVKFN